MLIFMILEKKTNKIYNEAISSRFEAQVVSEAASSMVVLNCSPFIKKSSSPLKEGAGDASGVTATDDGADSGSSSHC